MKYPVLQSSGEILDKIKQQKQQLQQEKYLKDQQILQEHLIAFNKLQQEYDKKISNQKQNNQYNHTNKQNSGKKTFTQKQNNNQGLQFKKHSIKQNDQNLSQKDDKPEPEIIFTKKIQKQQNKQKINNQDIQEITFEKKVDYDNNKSNDNDKQEQDLNKDELKFEKNKKPYLDKNNSQNIKSLEKQNRKNKLKNQLMYPKLDQEDFKIARFYLNEAKDEFLFKNVNEKALFSVQKLKSLKGELNDLVINEYIRLLNNVIQETNNTNISLNIFNTYFYTLIPNKIFSIQLFLEQRQCDQQENLLEWQKIQQIIGKKQNMFPNKYDKEQKCIWFIPMYIGVGIDMHWVFAEINLKTQVITYYDSLNSQDIPQEKQLQDAKQKLKKILYFLNFFYMYFIKAQKNPIFKIEIGKTILQEDGSLTCGLIMLQGLKMRIFNQQIEQTFKFDDRYIQKVIMTEFYKEQIIVNQENTDE
ncbi:hypothetical protein PPERSA_05986 [Pseudocohnilembus persalinus]|uniref:Ubiquitin-like protease family profile domain-containing protein n=1 Tax=Pseudocohnilembus persalinus TaxID=266149 RepID=A0A0V0R506_PSEPJ|nr:hypothetical protein PPERSA_05986 [Pseudocohnilembus persalinus]|eukprot:KRX09317.1 hypothetical protein PPERSA_05986 [Pseudocohnilembus persalinus]